MDKCEEWKDELFNLLFGENGIEQAMNEYAMSLEEVGAVTALEGFIGRILKKQECYYQDILNKYYTCGKLKEVVDVVDRYERRTAKLKKELIEAENTISRIQDVLED
jgi:hypothetical protein